MIEYSGVVKRVLRFGENREARNEPTTSIFGTTLQAIDLRKGFPLITTRKIDYKQAFGELAAFIQSCTYAEEFNSYGCKYWDSYGNEEGYLGPIYGAQWRDFKGASGKTSDQLYDLVKGLKNDPFSRRHVMSTWHPAYLKEMALPPCHIVVQFYVSGDKKELSCMVYMRSVDVMLGLPYDIAVYALLLKLLAKDLGMEARYLKMTFGDTHIYEGHMLGASEQLNRSPKRPPKLNILPEYKNIFTFHPDQVEIVDYNPHPPIKFGLYK